MGIRFPKSLPLPDPRAANLTIDEPMMQYLIRLNASLQEVGHQIREGLMSNTLSGTEVLDDGANWKVTRGYDYGRLISVSIAASSGSATATWTPV